MKIGAYQFAVTSDIAHNLQIMKKAILRAQSENVKLLVFPECALTGYPPHDIENSSVVDFDEVALACEEIQTIAIKNDMYIIVGAITRELDKYHNSAIVFTPDRQNIVYHKRALWGWDKDNFITGDNNGIFEIAGVRVGIRICFEVRFPEFFRELYAANTDLNIILFYDVSDNDSIERYDLIKSHIRTRAVENVCPTLTVNTIRPYQTAPTGLFGKSGNVLTELKRNEEDLLIYDFEKTELSFGQQGIKQLSDYMITK